MQAIQEYFLKGGVFMYPIAAFSFWAMLLILERVIFFLQVSGRTTRMHQRFLAALEGGGLEGARAFLAGQHGILKNVLSAAIERAHLPAQKINQKVDTVLLDQLPGLSRFLNLIATLGTLLPMLGLLGTVTGMIATFKVIALQGTGDAQAMADGISEALITTQAGLVAAIPIVLCHTFLSNRVSKLVAVIRASVTRLLDFLENEKP
jgi:biopolymer transport protein ExbB